MFRHTFIFLSLILIILAYNPLMAHDEYSYDIRTDINSLKVQDGSAILNNDVMISKPGAPKIGYRIVRLALPQGKSIVDYTVETAEPVFIGMYNLDYVVGDLKTGNYPADTAFSPNPEIYGFDNLYPEKRVEILNKGNWGDINLVNLAVYPLAYRPLSGKVLFYPEIAVKFHLEQSVTDPQLRLKSDRVAHFAARDLIENKMDLPMSKEAPPLPKITSGIPSPEYLIISSGAIARGFNSFREWKNQKGVPTDIVLIEDILSTTPGCDIIKGLFVFTSKPT